MLLHRNFEMRRATLLLAGDMPTKGAQSYGYIEMKIRQTGLFNRPAFFCYHFDVAQYLPARVSLSGMSNVTFKT